MLLRGSALCDIFRSSVKTLLVRCPSVLWQPDGLTSRTKKKWFLGAGFLGAPPNFSQVIEASASSAAACEGLHDELRGCGEEDVGDRRIYVNIT